MQMALTLGWRAVSDGALVLAGAELGDRGEEAEAEVEAGASSITARHKVYTQFWRNLE
jgi:hypothetical protein